MAQPSIPDYFGASAQIAVATTEVTATAANPALIIRFADFSAQDLSDVASFSDPDKLLAALVRKVKTWLDADATEDPGVQIPTLNKSFTVRASQQRIAWQYDLFLYTPDTTSSAPDPDEVV